ncbi:MAG TPA: N-acetylglucosamine-6-phosphate deacetylase [Burkholderiaceae bacterium]|nr:N-acetylglucosamine-6-phosphate deacetylase [Burkholderiaceae bacterium]
MTAEALVGAVIFDGDRRHDGAALLIEAGQVVAIVAAAAVPPSATRVDLDGGWLAPAFVDAQVNGGGGALFNASPASATLETIAAAHRKFGVAALLPTLITTTPTIERAAIDVVARAVKATPGIAGLHLEGPHLAPSRHGAHPAAWMRPLEDDDVDRLVAIRETVGTLLVTLAVEQAPPARIRRLADHGVVVSLGHSDAGYEAARRAFDAGARGVTHLFNAMSPLRHREPGLVGAALEAGNIWCGVIADGVHVHPAALRIALRAKRGPGRIFFVTDAMPTVGSDLDEFDLEGRRVRRRDGVLALDDGTLAGSDLDMAAAVRHAIGALECTPEEALRMASRYPARCLGLQDRFGTIAPGRRADLVHLDADWRVRRTWMAGVASAPADAQPGRTDPAARDTAARRPSR